MANESRFTLRHGTSAPPNGALLPYELGYNTETGELYIGLQDEDNTNKLLVPTGLSDLPTSINNLSGELNKIKEDLPKTYLAISGKAKDSEKADSATKDGEGYIISSTYAKIAKDGKVQGAISAESAETANTAGSATKATQDGDGNVISSTYLKLSGGTLTGSLSLPILILSTDSYGTSTPTTGVEGQIYFVRETI